MRKRIPERNATLGDDNSTWKFNTTAMVSLFCSLSLNLRLPILLTCAGTDPTTGQSCARFVRAARGARPPVPLATRAGQESPRRAEQMDTCYYGERSIVFIMG